MSVGVKDITGHHGSKVPERRLLPDGPLIQESIHGLACSIHRDRLMTQLPPLDPTSEHHFQGFSDYLTPEI